mmetsp:Transcript_20465/g.63255  ORF Transcript_20465/g.63255 Transcript_20465/m.63255 type:complete len:108 (-) Transcript_20465:999-1322(-)|eukprot:CAMPEP_0198649346 /NCGR_PEP_ID=MMETSP1467-20131203/4191_1 /TAXON_ID=1462469 /ORGANISM="unid. sp., Strain CCMP2135" /LENGTH=107 /DNA_ID=CAMNT_0044385125 /DNA_START=688 /DNA_END=1011 /DNA_ORIENTATION=+
MSKQKPTMLTAKYDMKMLKQIVEIDDGMKGRLCELVGVEDEDSLPDAVQNLDLQEYLGFTESEAKAELMKVFVTLAKVEECELHSLAADVSKRIQGLCTPETAKETN